MTSRKRRQELRKLMAHVSQVADERLRQAVEEGLIDLSDLPADTRQRLQDAIQPPLEGHIVEGEIFVDPPLAPISKRR